MKKKDFIATVDPGGRTRLRGAVLLFVLAASALGQYPQHRLFKQPNLPRAFGAMFQVAPISGVGMGTPCACVDISTAGGIVGVTTRAGGGMCTKQGFTTTGLQVGDMVLCSSNLPRVETDINGIIGALYELLRQNVLVRVEELDNAAWSNAASVSGNPTLNSANAGTFPWGNATAEDYTFPSTTASAYSVRVQANICPTGTVSGSCFVKGVSGSGTMDLGIVTNTSGPVLATANCAYVDTSWTRCLLENVTVTSGGSFDVGNLSLFNGGTARAANRVLIGGCQCEAGAWASSYIATTSAAVSRAVDQGTGFTVPSMGPTACLSASVQFASTAVGAVNVAYFAPNGTSEFGLYRSTNTAAGFDIGGTTTTPAVSAIGTTVHRAMLRDNAGVRAAFWDGVSVTAPAATMAGAVTTIRIGSGPNISSPVPPSAIVSLVQADNNPARCTP